MELLNTLYVTTAETYLRLENKTVRIEVERELRLQVPLHHLVSVVCFGNVGFSTPLVHTLADAGIALVLLDANGRFKARIEGAVGGNVLLRRAQHGRACDSAFGLEVARNMVAGKVKNARNVILRGARDSKVEDDAVTLARSADDLAAALRSLAGVASLDELRGVEGHAAKRYFACIGRLVRADARPAFAMDGRNRRPPRDRFNALISFLYSMWMNDCRSALESVGLDPQVGFLHALRPGRAALALDLVEEFRPFADRLALTLVNREQLRAKDFTEQSGGGVALSPDARKLVVTAFQERKKEELAHPLLAQPIALGLAPFIQARLLARALRGETETYVPFVFR
ncbi:MAG: type I-C CRISPR-associated endonuclease Cas1c [Burkholderiaceae bacterium]